MAKYRSCGISNDFSSIFLIELLVEKFDEDYCQFQYQSALAQCSDLPTRSEHRIYRIKQMDEEIQNHGFGNCFLMNLLNRAVPIWEKVSCNLPLVQQVICQKRKQSSTPRFLANKTR